MIVSICRQLGIILPVAWLLGRLFGLDAIWLAFPIAEIGAVIISFAMFYRIYQNELKDLRPRHAGTEG